MIWLLLTGLAIGTAQAAGKPPVQGLGLLETGRKIYRDGILTNGKPLLGNLPGMAELSGADAACSKCHRRSGLGTLEGGSGVLPVTGTALYTAGPAGLWQKYGFKTDSSDWFRPAYTDASLAKAIRSGITSSGRRLKPPMPRYALSDRDLQALLTYLKSLSNSPSPGVDDTTLYLATVVTPDSDPAARKAMLDVMTMFLKEKNTETRNESGRRRTQKEAMYTSYRKLDLAVWDLQGEPATWLAQLQEKYRQRPVFALVSGLGGNDWKPVHDFCEHQEVACLFPNTAVSAVKAGDFFSVYFSRGLALEAEALAEYLATVTAPASKPVTLVYRATPQAQAAVGALRSKLGNRSLTEHRMAIGEVLESSKLVDWINAEPTDDLVLWLPEPDLAALDPSVPASARIYLSASLSGDSPPPHWRKLGERLHWVSVHDDAETRKPRMARTRIWLQSRQVAITHEVLQADTFWALLTVTDALKHLAGNFSTAYLLERVEDMTESVGVTSLYPRLSLGPRQRFAAKSARIFRLDSDGKPVPASDWLSP